MPKKKPSQDKQQDVKEQGALGFSESYWRENYHNLDDMDGIYNARDHALYLRAVFALDQIQIRSVADFGFGPGHLFAAVLDTFKPYKCLGLEPSISAFTRAQQLLKRSGSTLLHTDLLSWCRDESQQKRFDLGLCTSVLQYLNDEELAQVLPILAQRLKYLYLTVPTSHEQQRFIDEYDFIDNYAYSRSREQYLAMLSPYFTIVSGRILESKQHFNEKNSDFTENLYRF
ncbi:methyltransferase family protein [Sinobacterium caligoides]|uniref:Methyltransferase family protein n=1 Tax=Sinobacterium caligoides TaxID=933926 RepID=A0A3N2DP68_9GAMM|nr:class I SAM-dependent methyltransferase [Sinobacterium caligoides]ROS01603.1 methyltransferase family protein [Sinobacterium caligoides]